MEKIQCSVPILTLNSEKFLARCLESVRNFDDVFLFDGNSTDRTLEIAKEYGIPVFSQTDTEEKNVEIKNFTEVRIKSIERCKHDWIFFLDSDEFLNVGLSDEVRNVLNSPRLDPMSIYHVEKKYSINEKRIDFSFNYPNYYPRLHNRKSGAGFKKGKIVHEQIYIPPNLKQYFMKNWVYSEVSPTYRACVEKDVFQLSLMKKSTFSEGSFKNRPHSLKISMLYFLRSINILYKSLKVYLKHGYKRSLPIGQVLRHVRVHFIMSWWRLIQVFLGKKSSIWMHK